MASEGITSKLDELAEKSANKTTAQYILANQALRDDLFTMLNLKLDPMIQMIGELQTKLSACERKIEESNERENVMLSKIKHLENKLRLSSKCSADDEDGYYLVGSSILREVQSNDIINGNVHCIRGGCIKVVKENIQNLRTKPNTIITQIGGNDLTKDGATVESVSADYEVMVTETKEKFPEAKVIVSGLPPRFSDDNIRLKVKDLNMSLKSWSEQNQIKFIDNEEQFELRSGAVDSSAYVMTGDMPCLHLNRRGSIRLLENIQKHVPGLRLSNSINEPQKKSYAEVLSKSPTKYQRNQRQGRESYYWENHSTARGCYNCGEGNHTVSQCKYDQKLPCFQCRKLGHKQKFCQARR